MRKQEPDAQVRERRRRRRTHEFRCRFTLKDIADRVAGRIQLSTDAYGPYSEAVDNAFHGKVDYAQIVKVFGKTGTEEQRRYSPPECIGCKKMALAGQPDQDHVSTSFVERQ